jgi:pyruvate dehydrogenase (quinone)
MNELITVKRYWERWTNPSLIFCVFNNEDLNQVTWEQRALSGDPAFPGTQWIPNFPYHRYAELCGFKGIYCDSPDNVGAAWDEALAAKSPCVLEFKVDNEIPPMAPHITKALAKHSIEAMAAGDPQALGVMEKSIKEKLVEFKESIPGLHSQDKE